MHRRTRLASSIAATTCAVGATMAGGRTCTESPPTLGCPGVSARRSSSREGDSSSESRSGAPSLTTRLA
jgi:hypothetical protein